MNNDPQSLQPNVGSSSSSSSTVNHEITAPVQTSTSSTTMRPSNPSFLNGIHPGILEGYQTVINTHLSEYPNDKIETFEEYAHIMDIKPRDKYREWPYYAAIFPENEDVMSAKVAEKEKKSRNNARNQKYHVIPSQILRTFNNFEANIEIPYIAGFIATSRDNEEVYSQIKKNLSNKIIKTITDFYSELGAVRLPIDYNLLYRRLYKYNDDVPNRMPRLGGYRKTRINKKRRYIRKSKRNVRKR